MPVSPDQSTLGRVKEIVSHERGVRVGQLIDLYETVSQELLTVLSSVSKETATQPGVDGRPLNEILFHILCWDRWETQAMREIGQGSRHPDIMKLRGYMDVHGQLHHYYSHSGRDGVDRFNADRADELRTLIQRDGWTWQRLLQETRVTSSAFVAEARAAGEKLEDTDRYTWRRLERPQPEGVYLLAVSIYHIALDGEHEADFELVRRNLC